MGNDQDSKNQSESCNSHVSDNFHEFSQIIHCCKEVIHIESHSYVHGMPKQTNHYDVTILTS